ncbi:NERD domain-containing protein [Candidatus Woesearchaeota archaeon]|nr:NERD domain-containing protein [Candidatus Woesearchaeota archaeon]
MAIIYGTIETEKRLVDYHSDYISSFDDVDKKSKEYSQKFRKKKKQFTNELPSRISNHCDELKAIEKTKRDRITKHEKTIKEKKQKISDLKNEKSIFKKINVGTRNTLGIVAEHVKKIHTNMHMNHQINKKGQVIKELDTSPEKVFSRENKELIHMKQTYDIIKTSSDYSGTYGERKVLKELMNLSDKYHVFCDYKIKLSRAVRYRRNQKARSSQIDFLVIGPTGIFPLEVKNWSKEFANRERDFEPHEQIDRAGLLLYVVLNNCFDFKLPIKKVLVSVQGNINYNPDFQYVKVCRINNLIPYILNCKHSLFSDQVSDICSELHAD